MNAAKVAMFGVLLALTAAPTSGEAQWISPYVRVVSLNLRNQGAGDIEVRLDQAICQNKPLSPDVAILRRARSSHFQGASMALNLALQGNFQVSVQTQDVTCFIEFIWVQRAP